MIDLYDDNLPENLSFVLSKVTDPKFASFGGDDSSENFDVEKVYKAMESLSDEDLAILDSYDLLEKGWEDLQDYILSYLGYDE
jgi:hypothetical protein